MGECEVIDFDARRIEPFIMKQIQSFLDDPPDTQHQEGYLSALLVIYREGLRPGTLDARVIAAERLLFSTRPQTREG